MHVLSPFILIIFKSIVLKHSLNLPRYCSLALEVYDKLATMDFLIILMSTMNHNITESIGNVDIYIGT